MGLTQKRLKELLHYDPETGLFTWLKRVANCVKIGEIAGGKTNRGYIRLRVDGKKYLANRLAFLYMTGKWPTNEVDHENTIRDDNSWKNLRDATRSQNCQNKKKARSDSKTSSLGVSFHKANKKFTARIQEPNGERIYLGSYLTLEEAAAAYLVAKRELHPFGTI